MMQTSITNPALDDAHPFGVGWTTQPHLKVVCVPRLRSWGRIPAQAPNPRSHPDADLAAQIFSIGLQRCVSSAMPHYGLAFQHPQGL